MEQEQTSQPNQSSPYIYYVIGAVVLIAVIAVGYFLRPQTTAPAAPQSEQAAETVVVPEQKEPITGLACEMQYYNPVVGIPGTYYLSVEGVDTTAASRVTCTITAEAEGIEDAVVQMDATLNPVPERNGNSFKCTTEGLNLPQQMPVKVSAELVDDLGETAACFRYFSLP